ncbi:molybdate ABC transporter substrate-binding protein [Thermoleptolyngbya sichuanensis A183]|uniref:Molybdate ABC transporter substrate-binding protein n=2 Tax=Thermoleptolyngbya TaxID=2303528 RepID=A0A6M8B7Y0_9CYAN|nr:molybdate ABC transporter substrate-binding protein [Thermoleptolyngbya sichuanensis]QKD82568.1 molybdate ABC transporter substrate-binding protein [Thermoleptolyngbya sichuanensis A183]
MKRPNWLTFITCVLLSLMLSVSCATQPPLAEPVELTVSSAIALTEPLEALKPLYQAEHPNITITYNFGASGELRQQIQSGAPVDIFISAAQKDMNDLEQDGLLLPETRNDLVKNQIVLVVPKNSTAIQSLQDLTQESVKRIAVGNPDTVPIGRYSEEVFKNLNLLDQVKPKFVFGKNVRQVLGYVESGNVDAALVWVTDAKTTDQVNIVEAIPENLHSPTLYPLAVIRASVHPDQAKEYVQFLLSPKAAEVFESFGFTPVS